ncbi:hypothetical protein DC31_05245 [Microbacterium sp. CH12i]|uniref:hypothetical protein n=1 Tax=Microbacterium sp. CH12i TaxID=1479651 RepID=UPI0004615DEC|nr:hypothetical protein [Microbacterium sp. CH12i]KDA04768.1 hypothetical protein DC31_05245 [Microbacterium sp. CH12i]
MRSSGAANRRTDNAHRRRESLTLTADPGRSERMRLLLGVIAAVCAVLGIWALLFIAIAAFGAAAVDGAAVSGTTVGGLIFGLVCCAFSWFCLVGVRRLRQTEKHGLLLQVEKDAVTTASGPILASDLKSAAIRWRRFPRRTRHPITGSMERWTGSGTHRTIEFTRNDGSTEDVYISLFATDEEFDVVVDRLLGMLTAHGIPVQRMS